MRNRAKNKEARRVRMARKRETVRRWSKTEEVEVNENCTIKKNDGEIKSFVFARETSRTKAFSLLCDLLKGK